MQELDTNVVPMLKLPSKSPEDVVEEAGEAVDWLLEDILARGAVTDFNGPAKKGGKTTFMLHAIAAGARSEEIADFEAKPARYLYLSEQGNNLAIGLEETGLDKPPLSNYIRIVQYKDIADRKWNELIRNAAEDVKALGFDCLIIDTVAKFGKLRGAEENEAGPVGERMQLLSLVTQQHNIASAIIRHAGKDGQGRGSSAFEAEVDMTISINRLGGNAPNTRRVLNGIGRYGEWERVVELTQEGYVSHGDNQQVQFKRAVKLIQAVLTPTPETTKQNILDANTEGISAATIDRALKWMTKEGSVGAKQQMHLQGKAWVYWNAAPSN
jgi:hypothetical protein